MEDPPRKVGSNNVHREIPKLDTIVPDDPNKPYDMKEIILAVIDDGHFLVVASDEVAAVAKVRYL